MAGILISPYQLGLLEGKILDISGELRKIALVVILTRAGLTLDIRNLKKVGRPTVLLSFVPAVFEMLGIMVIGMVINQKEGRTMEEMKHFYWCLEDCCLEVSGCCYQC